MIDAIEFFNGRGFMPHGHCYLWKPGLVWLHIVSDSLTALAYYSIPLTLCYFARNRRDLPFNWVFMLFATFITACGTTHILDVWTLWHPVYWLSGTAKAITASVSVGTAAVLIPLIPKALALPSPSQLKTVNQQLGREIADREKIQKTLQESEERYRSVIASLAEGVVLQDMNGIQTCNASAEQILGLTLEQMQGRTSLDPRWRTVHEDGSPFPGTEHPATITLQTGKICSNVTMGVHRPNGNLIWVSINSQPLFQSGASLPDAVVVSFFDISDRKQVEAALRQSEAKNRAMLAAIPDLLLRVRRDGSCLDCIPPTDGEAGRFVPIKSHLSEVLPPDMLKRQLQRVEQALATGELQVWEHQLPKDGSLYDEEVRLVPCGDDECLIIVRDISDRKQAEAALRQTEQKFKSAFDSLSTGMCLVSVSGGLQEANASLCQMLGYSQSELLSLRLEDMIHPDYQYWDLDLVEQLFEGEIPAYQVEKRFLRRNGEPFWGLFNVGLMRDEQQLPLYLIAQITDISERKRIEQELELQDTIVKNMAEGICLVRPADGTIVYANPKFEQMFGYSIGELNGKPVSVVNYEDQDEQTAKAIMQNILNSGEATFEVYNVKKNGTPFWCRATASVYEHPDFGTVLVTVQHDITLAKRAEDALAHTVSLLKATLESTADGILVLDAKGKKLTFNTQFVQMWHVPDSVLTSLKAGSDEKMLPYVLSQVQDPEAFVTAMRQMMSPLEGETFDRFELVDGRVLERYARPQWLGQHCVGKVLSFRDVTEREQSEQWLQKSLREKEVLLKEIHHRVKNNLQIIYSLLRLQRRTLQDPQIADILLDSQSRIESIALIHEKLYGAGDLATIDFSQYIPGLVSNLLSSYHTQSRQIVCDTEIDAIFLDIDKAVPCGLIINELIANSLKYAFPEQHEGRIQVQFHAINSANVCLVVKDNGIGLPEGFDLTQINSLGLQLVQDFVAQLKGTLEIDGSAGAEFKITFLKDKP